MRRKILHDMRFRGPKAGWNWPCETAPLRSGPDLTAPRSESIRLQGPGVHTRNGDSIELHFRLLESGRGYLRFGFTGGFESAVVRLDFDRNRATLSTADWTRPQPLATVPLRIPGRTSHVLLLEKTEGAGRLVKHAHITAYLDGRRLLRAENLNILPEMGVALSVSGTRLRAERFVHRGSPSGVPEYLHVGGWQVINQPSIEENLASMCRGLRAAAEQGVELLVTPETSLTGLFPSHRVTRQAKLVEVAERRLRRFIRQLENAPYLVVGLPVWQRVAGHRLEKTRYNACRVYDPEGHVLSTHPKIHSCEQHFQHGYRLNEFEVQGVPICLHICHDGRYPEVWTLPVMFGARLILHPSNGGKVSGSIDAFEATTKASNTTSHAFYLRVNGLGGSSIVGPQKYNSLIAVSPECRRDTPTFPVVGAPCEGLFHANIRVHDAFGYWPMRSFRASESAAEAYLALYRSLGGRRLPQ